MQNWDDYRYFLAVSNKSSIRQAALELGVSHSTVLRRITCFEEALGARLFERLPTGYFLTEAGEEALQHAKRIAEEVNSVNRRIEGRDTLLTGKISVTMPGFFASHLLMADLTEFQKKYPSIQLAINSNYFFSDLAQREADVAFRVCNEPPEYLFGRRLAKVLRTVYISRQLLTTVQKSENKLSIRWLSTTVNPNCSKLGIDQQYSVAAGTSFSDPFAALQATKEGMGVAALPCFVGDNEPLLCRLPGSLVNSYDLWVLIHEDLRNTVRIRRFLEFMSNAFAKHKDLFPN